MKSLSPLTVCRQFLLLLHNELSKHIEVKGFGPRVWCVSITNDPEEFLWPLDEYVERRVKPAVSLMANQMLSDAVTNPKDGHFDATGFTTNSDTYGGLWGRFAVEGDVCVFSAAFMGGASVGNSMNEARARKLLGDIVQDNGDLGNGLQYVDWAVGDDDVVLDGWFTADELEAIAWWMRNKT